MKNFNRQTGMMGENLAANYLMNLGYVLIKRNFSTRFGEIDIIMKDGNVLVFVEVKTKKGLGFGTPEEMFTKGKQERVRKMANYYLKGEEVSCRVDMVGVVLSETDEVLSLKHYHNVTEL